MNKSKVSPVANSKPSLLLPCELANDLRWHEESIRRAIRDGRIAAVKIGRGWRIPVSELTRIAANGL